MDDLVAFMRDRLDDDEQAARRVNSSWRQIGETGVIASDGDRAEECANGNWTGIAEHIVRHDPVRVLADIEVKRELIKLHKSAKLSYLPSRERGCVTCSTAQAWDAQAGEANCQTLRLLALPYADHPDYRDAWRP
jgi:hypothetical protein